MCGWVMGSGGAGETSSTQRAPRAPPSTPLNPMLVLTAPTLTYIVHSTSCRRQDVSNQREQDEPQWIVAQKPLSALTILGSMQVVRKGLITPDQLVSTLQSLAQLLQSCPKAILVPATFFGNDTHTNLASMDSDLEAFSHNPAGDSFAVLAFQLAALTKYLNEVFLSY